IVAAIRPGPSLRQTNWPLSVYNITMCSPTGTTLSSRDCDVVFARSLSRVWVTSEVPESKIRLFRVGGIADLELIAYPNETFHAKITRIADSVDSETRTVKVNAELENGAGKLRPDMFGSLRYSAGDVLSPWIPEPAVVRLNGVDLVFVEKSPGRFSAVPVELGKLQQSGFPILKGLKVGDRVVVQGAVYLKAAL
ncbi:MAG TPA: efflux RND transporter periplasmic adaptor subunit, partial [Bryobacteraceae bacterium]|nr:efflux RND transporter periplasmic adaptor subunit [Bryobacteraceae bacterium]